MSYTNESIYDTAYQNILITHYFVYKMKSTLFALLLISTLPLAAQNKASLPKWITTPPQSTPTSQKVLSTGTSFQEARHNAVNQLIGLTNLIKEENSYQKRLLDSGREPISQHQALVAAAEQSTFFKNLNTYDQDGQYWVLCEMTSQDLTAFGDSLYTAIKEQTCQYIDKARSLRKEGDLYGAASQYSLALQGIVPMLHKEMATDEGNLVDILHKEYVHSLDNIKLKLDRSECPMVMGEEVPFDIMVSATYNDLPVSALPLTFKISDDGKANENGKTDGRGRAKTRILSAPNKPTGKLSVYTDLLSLSSTLPQNIFSMELTQHLALEPEQDQMALTAFDPTPTYFVQIDSLDMECLSDSISSLMKRGGNKPAANASEADLLLKLSVKSEPDGVPTTGKYAMQYYLCDMCMTLTDRRTEAELAKAEKTGLRLFVKAGTDENQLRILAVTELYRRLRTQLNNISDVKFDKRKVMYANTK